jgi:hypothetical protein
MRGRRVWVDLRFEVEARVSAGPPHPALRATFSPGEKV